MVYLQWYFRLFCINTCHVIFQNLRYFKKFTVHEYKIIVNLGNVFLTICSIKMELINKIAYLSLFIYLNEKLTLLEHRPTSLLHPVQNIIYCVSRTWFLCVSPQENLLKKSPRTIPPSPIHHEIIVCTFLLVPPLTPASTRPPPVGEQLRYFSIGPDPPK